jgi:tetratricopeptide (TPR) repeat protein
LKKKPDANRKQSAPALSPRRRFGFRLAAIVLFPLLVFSLTEICLRMAGFGHDTAFFKRVRIDGRDFLVNNDDFVLRFFPPQLARLPAALRMEAEKPPGICRIFVLGESAALGDPSPPYGAGRYLQALLSEHFPGRKFEVVNVAITAINSHAILPIARECARHQGDFWIIYMGNNEMVGPFGAASVFGVQAPPRSLAQLSLELQKTRTGQLLLAVGRRLKGQNADAASWGGMQMFLGHQLPPEDPRKETVYRNFRENLHDIVCAGLDSGAHVILNTVAVNLKDCPPFGSLPPGSATHCADADYRTAQGLLESGDPAAAVEFQKACDDDLLPFRADSRINGIIRKTAREEAGAGVIFCDASAPSTLDEPPGSIAGNELFYEHVHFNFEGNYRLGRAWARAIDPLLPPEARIGSSPGWASRETCERRLGLTDWNRDLTLREMAGRRSEPPLNRQSNNARELEELRRQHMALQERMNESTAFQARAVYVEAIQRAPDDYLLRFNYGDFLEATGDVTEAVSQWRQVEELLPQYYLGYLQEGRMLERAGRLDEAADRFERTVALNSRAISAWFELSNIHASQGKLPDALGECERARRLEPDEPVFYVCLGRLQSRANNHAAAIDEYRKSIQLRPDYFDGHLALGEELSATGQNDGAEREISEALRLRPDSARAHLALGRVLLQQGRRDAAKQQFQQTLRLEPGNKQAGDYLESNFGEMGAGK